MVMGLNVEESDKLLCRLFRRCYGSFKSTQPASRIEKNQQHDPPTLAVTNVYEFAREVDATQQALHSKMPPLASVFPLDIQITQYPTLDGLDEILRELHDFYERSDNSFLSQREQKYTALLTQAAVESLAHACLASNCDDLDASRIRVKLVEVATNPSEHWRRLAFTLFFDTSVACLAAILSTHENNAAIRAQHLETKLYHLLREMVTKAVIIYTASQSTISRSFDWVDQVVACLSYFVKNANSHYSTDRLRLLDERTLLFLVTETSNRNSITSIRQLQAMELVVATMYAFKFTSACKSVGSERQSPIKDHRCGLPLALVEQFISLELLLYFFYNSIFVRLQRLAYMVLVDCAGDELQSSGSCDVVSTVDLDIIYHTLVDLEDPAMGMRHALFSPYISSTCIARQLALSCSVMSVKHLSAYINQFRLIAQIDAYFGLNLSLECAMNGTKKPDDSSIPIATLSHISILLQSHHAVERFRGERWLAELISYNHKNEAFSSYDSKLTATEVANRKQSEALLLRPKPAHGAEDLKDSFCHDEGWEISVAAQATFWDLALPTNPVEIRTSFTKVLTLFIQRKLKLCSGMPDTSTIEEVNTCLHVLLDYEESEAAVLIPLMLLIIDISQCKLSHIDKQWKQKDAYGQTDTAFDRVACSDSLASRVLNGNVALDKSLLRQLDVTFFLHVLRTVLHETYYSNQGFQCPRFCSELDICLVGDVTACAALIVSHTLLDKPAELDKIGGLAVLTPLLLACDTRIAVLMAKLVSELMKRTNEAQYAAFLRELYVACIEADDEKALYNSYFHTQTMLHSYGATG